MTVTSNKNDVFAQQIIDRLPLLFRCGHNLIPTLAISTSLPKDVDLPNSLSVFRTNVISSLSNMPNHSLPYCGVAVLHHLTSLIGEDFALTGHYGNCLRYLDMSIASLQCLPSGSLYRCVEYMAKARDTIRHRKRNINNNVIDLDEILKMNFLNRVDQLDQAMVALREMLLISIIRQHRTIRQRHKAGNSINGALYASGCPPLALCNSSVDTSSESDDDYGPIPRMESIPVNENQGRFSVIINNNQECEKKNPSEDPLPGAEVAGDEPIVDVGNVASADD